MRKMQYIYDSRLVSTVIAVTAKAMDWSVLTFILLTIICGTSIDRMQANKQAADTFELTHASEAALHCLAALKEPESPDKAERLRAVDNELSRQITRLQRNYN